MKRILASALVLVATAWLGAEKLATLPDLMKPTQLVVEKDYIYVGEFPSVYIYSRADGSLLKKFGKDGEGPREFYYFLILRVVDDRLLVNSMNKITFYTLTGEYIEEKRVNVQTGLNLMPLAGNRYVARGYTTEDNKQFVTVNLLDGEGKKIRELGRMPSGMRGDRMQVLHETMAYETDGERIFLMIGNQFEIDVFNVEGEKVFTISREYERTKFTEKHREMLLEEMRTNPQTKQYFDLFKERAVFPDYWPAISAIYPQGDFLYVMTYKRENDTYEVFVLKTDGTLVERKMVPFRFLTAMQPYPADVKNGRLYQLIENDDEEWELHAWPL
ncbi:MAG: hypothetical protein RB296_02200 [Acidobacteriota bacterium]|jgi:hypothetical protein|nr:hypothetical protein [Acidobacteriota bacterium]